MHQKIEITVSEKLSPQHKCFGSYKIGERPPVACDGPSEWFANPQDARNHAHRMAHNEIVGVAPPHPRS